jgi:hypothetical protein
MFMMGAYATIYVAENPTLGRSAGHLARYIGAASSISITISTSNCDRSLELNDLFHLFSPVQDLHNTGVNE